jgi:hypothetical protein
MAFVVWGATTALPSMSYAQTDDFRNRPWNAEDVRGVSHPVIRIGTDGALLDGLPQYIYNNARTSGCITKCILKERTLKGLTIQLTSPDGSPVTFKGDPLDHWENHLKATWRRMIRGELNWVFNNADMGGSDTRWDISAYADGLRKKMNGGKITNGEALFLPEHLQRPAVASNIGEYRYIVEIGQGRGSNTGSLKSAKLSASGTLLYDFATEPKPKIAEGPLRISVKRTPERTEQVRSWFTTTKRRHERHIAPLKAGLYRGALELEAIAKEARDEVDGNKCGAVQAKWDQSKTKVETVIAQSDSLIAHWMIEWLWYTNGVATLDPFKRPAKPKRSSDTLSVVLLRGEVDAYDKQLACCSAERTPAELAQLVKARKDAQSELTLMLKRNKEVTDSTAARNAVTKFLREPSVVLNDVLLYLSNKDRQHFMRHFDGAKTYGSMTPTLRGEYYTFEKRHFLVHNYRGDAKLLELTATTEAITSHDPAVAEEVNAQLGALTSLISNTAAAAIESRDFHANISTSRQSDPEMHQYINALDGGQKSVLYLSRKPVCDAVIRKIKPEHEALEQGASHRYAQLDSILDVFKVDAQPAEETTLMRSVEVEMKTTLKAKQRVSYTLMQLDEKDESKKKTLRTGTFDLYELQRIRLFGGVSYAVPFGDSVARTTVTVTGGQLTDVQRANEQARFMVGLKFHVFGGGAEVDDNRFTFHPRRLAIAAGVGLPKPKDDLYLGLSYDLYPGFNVNLLCQWYRSDVVDLKNGQVLETGSVYQATPAIAVTLDSSLFTSLLKLFAL